MPDQSKAERTCPVCHRLVEVNTEPHVRQALLDLEGKWVRPHYQSYHVACHLALGQQGIGGQLELVV